MHEIFISYSRANTAAVDQIESALNSAGAPTWLDRRDIPVSLPWLDEVRGAIAASSLVAVYKTPEWSTSEACRLELMMAQEHSKRVVYVDPTQGTEDAAERIIAEYRATSDVQRTHSELLRRGSGWHRAHRPRRALATGQLLRRLRQVEDEEDLALTPEARDYLAASGSRDRRRKMSAGAGASVLTLSLLSFDLVHDVQKQAHDRLEARNTELIGSAAARQKLESDVYGALLESSDQVRKGQRSFLVRARLMDALNIPVPDRSVIPSAYGVSGFTSQLVAATPALIDGRGRPVTVTPATASPRRQAKTTTVSDDAGTLTLTVSGHTVTMTAGRRPVRPPCRTGTLAAVAPDGRSAATADGATICSWHPGGRNTTVRLLGGSRITALASYAGGLAAGTSDGRVYRVANGQAPRRVHLTEGAGAVNWLVPAHRGDLIAVGHAGSGVVDVFRPRTGVLYRRMATTGADHAAAFSPDDRVLAIGAGPAIQLFDVPNGLSRVTLNGSVGEVHAIAWSTDGARVWAIADHSRVSSWLRRTGTVLTSDPSKWFIGLTGPDPQGHGFAATRSGELDTVDLNHGTLIDRVRTSASEVVALASPATGRVAALGMDGKVVIRDTRVGTERTLSYPGCDVVSLAFARSPGRLYVGCQSGNVRLVDLDDGRILRTVSLPDDAAASIAPTGDTVFIGGEVGRIFTVRADLTGLKTIYSANKILAFSGLAPTPDGKSVVTSGDGVNGHGGSLVLEKDDQWKKHSLLYSDDGADQSRALALNPRSGFAAVGFSDGTVRMLDPVKALAGWTWTDPAGSVRGLAFSQDGTRLTVATRDGLLETIAACPSCESVDALATIARQRLTTAHRLGLTQRTAGG